MAGQPPENWSEQVEAAWHQYGRELWAMFYAQCSDAERAGDAVQEAFARLQAQDGVEIREPRAWLLRVGRNWLRDVARRERVAASSSDGLDFLAGVTDSPEAVLEDAELQGQVRQGLDQLRVDDRQVLVLRYALNWSSIRIAEALETSPAAVDMRLSRARNRLAEALRQLGVNVEQE
ncbi:MAG: sigma-70 family RNA polymerase sigma factor [Planctomycetaceae bacterium]|nr:sigma-70 family RNA polymerase sigma factor [Planctomycetaceae bacterium]